MKKLFVAVILLFMFHSAISAHARRELSIETLEVADYGGIPTVWVKVYVKIQIYTDGWNDWFGFNISITHAGDSLGGYYESFELEPYNDYVIERSIWRNSGCYECWHETCASCYASIWDWRGGPPLKTDSDVDYDDRDSD